jgi:phosphatidylglycerophosphate synthase
MAKLRAIGLFKQTANLLTVLRFALAATWAALFITGSDRPSFLLSLAIVASLSDFLDGPIARRGGATTEGIGSWLDPVADVTFVTTALFCKALSGAIPIYIPALIVISFAQYTVDSLFMSRSSSPVRSQIGHFCGVLNFVLVLVLAVTPWITELAVMARRLSPLVACVYLGAILERMMSYWPTGATAGTGSLL